jgi:carbon monoxide dehydrogenase subunit G
VRLTVRAVLHAPPARVWAVMTDWERQASWMPDVAWIRVIGPERAQGARLLVRTKDFGIPAVTDEVQVTRWEPPTRLAVRHLGLVKGGGEWRLEPVDGGTHFEWIEDLSLPFGLFGELALRMYGPVQRSMLRRSARNLRRMADAAS